MTEREKTWAGPRQFLNKTSLNINSNYQLEFMVRTSADLSLKCKVHIKINSQAELNIPLFLDA